MRHHIILISLTLTFAMGFGAGCKKRDAGSDSTAPAASSTEAATPAGPKSKSTETATSGASSGEKYSPAMKKEQVDRASSAEIETESQVIAILGEPTERSAVRQWYNAKYSMNMEEYDLTWYKSEGNLAVKITFLNKRKTTVLSSLRD